MFELVVEDRRRGVERRRLVAQPGFVLPDALDLLQIDGLAVDHRRCADTELVDVFQARQAERPRHQSVDGEAVADRVVAAHRPAEGVEIPVEDARRAGQGDFVVGGGVRVGAGRDARRRQIRDDVPVATNQVDVQ